MRLRITRRTWRFGIFSLVLLFGLALRLVRLVDVPFDYDRSYSPGIAIALLDSISTGTFGQTALIGQPSSLGWPNPVLANYLVVLIALFDRSPLFIELILASVSTIVIAFSYDIGRRMAGVNAGWIAAALAAGSPWAIYFSRGGWQLSLFELAISLPAWLLLRGILQRRSKIVLSSLVAAAVTAHIYLVGFGLMLQVLVQTGLIASRHPAWRKIAITGLALCGLSVLAYVPILLNANPAFLAQPGMRLAYGAGGPDSAPDSTLPLNLFAVQRAFGEVSGADFESILVTSPAQANPVRSTLMNIRVLLVTAALLVGMAISAVHGRKGLAWWTLLAWFWAPVLAITALISVSRGTPVSYYYLALTAPAGYVLGGIGLAWIGDKLFRDVAGRVVGIVVGGYLLLAGMPSSLALVEQYATVANPANVQSLPLRQQLILREVWSQSCHELSVPYNPFENRLNLEYWAMGLTGSAIKVRPATEAQINTWQVWATRAEGGTCTIRMINAPEPPSAIPISLLPPLDDHVKLYLSKSTYQKMGLASTNFGWSLVDAQVPQVVHSGQIVRLNFDWRIEHLPVDIDAQTRYDLFVKLRDDSGKTIAQADAASIPGRSWRVTDQVAQSLVLDVPANLSPGSYVLAVSLYDRSEQRTALFDLSTLAQPDGLALLLPVYVDR